MYTKKLFTASWLLIGLMLIAAACSRAETTPTPDPEAVYTQAAQTVQAGLTQTAALLPTHTATLTPVPTGTATATLPVLPTSETSPVNTLAPTSQLPKSADKAEWVSQNPADGTIVSPGQEFTTAWAVKNIGTTTWNTKYQLRYYLADAALRFSASDIKFPKEVKPGESVDLSVNMKAPGAGGDYTSIWVLTNDQGYNFYTLTLTIKVSGAAATATPTLTQAATEAATVTATPES